MNEDTYPGKATDPLSLNRYTYCENDPVNYCDPTGHIREGYTDDKGVYHADPDAEEFGKDSDTYKILVDLGNKWDKADADERERLHEMADDARKHERDGKPYMYGNDKVLSLLHLNAKEALDFQNSLNKNWLFLASGGDPYSTSYEWFVSMTCSYWDYKKDPKWQIPYNSFSPYGETKSLNMNVDNNRNWRPWIYFEGNYYGADKIGNINLGYVGTKMGFGGKMLLNVTTTYGSGDAEAINLGISLAKSRR